jgi:hypothetical protein
MSARRSRLWMPDSHSVCAATAACPTPGPSLSLSASLLKLLPLSRPRARCGGRAGPRFCACHSSPAAGADRGGPLLQSGGAPRALRPIRTPGAVLFELGRKEKKPSKLNLDKSPNRTQQGTRHTSHPDCHPVSTGEDAKGWLKRARPQPTNKATEKHAGGGSASRRGRRTRGGTTRNTLWAPALWQPGGGASLRPAAPCCALLLGAQKHGRGRGASASAGSFSDDLLVVVASTVIDATPGRPAKGSQRKQPDPLTARSPRAHTIRCLCCFCAHWQIAFFPPTHFRAPRLSLSTSICSSSRPLFFGVSTS